MVSTRARSSTIEACASLTATAPSLRMRSPAETAAPLMVFSVVSAVPRVVPAWSKAPDIETSVVSALPSALVSASAIGSSLSVNAEIWSVAEATEREIDEKSVSAVWKAPEACSTLSRIAVTRVLVLLADDLLEVLDQLDRLLRGGRGRPRSATARPTAARG